MKEVIDTDGEPTDAGVLLHEAISKALRQIGMQNSHYLTVVLTPNGEGGDATLDYISSMNPNDVARTLMQMMESLSSEGVPVDDDC